ncbi:unnamed protein product [Linum trigynum]|uniref:RRM domain-containing protein n=1 Tax=Linum trigynum TaxID=586398 RepID=A0AAV2E432_9ROSI
MDGNEASSYYQPSSPGHFPVTYYQQTLPHPPLPPPHVYIPRHQVSPTPYTPSYGAYSSSDAVCILFVASLPDDVKPREIYNLFREFLGYGSFHLQSSGDGKPSSVAAIHALNGMVFDLEEGSTLYIDLDKSNSRSKRSKGDDERSGLDKKVKRFYVDSTVATDSGLGVVHLPGTTISHHNTIGYPSALSHESFDARAPTYSISSKLTNSSVPPCPTLFLSNLGPQCREHELTQVFSRWRGFLKLKVQSTYGPPVVFVDFLLHIEIQFPTP